MRGQPAKKIYNNFDKEESQEQPKQTESAILVKKSKGITGKEAIGKILLIADLPEDTCEEDLSIFFKDYEPALIKILK